MHNRDEYIDKVDRSVKRPIDPIYKIPEDRIAELAIQNVAKKHGVSESIVAKIHDFQWAQVNKSVSELKLVHVSKLFKFKMIENKTKKYIQHLEKQINQLDEKYLIVSRHKRKDVEAKKNEIREVIKQLQKQLGRSIQSKNNRL